MDEEKRELPGPPGDPRHHGNGDEDGKKNEKNDSTDRKGGGPPSNSLVVPNQKGGSSDDDGKSSSKNGAATGTASGGGSGGSGGSGSTTSSRIRALAEARLSQFAARLVLDPDRKRGLVEPPQVIPLNDEYLKEFGRRTKAFDEARGVSLDIERTIDDDDDQEEGDDDGGGGGSAEKDRLRQQQRKVAAARRQPKDPMRKVKICNLKFTTSEKKLHEELEAFGKIDRLHLLGDKKNTDRNIGIAYVTFENASMAEECNEKFKELDGRPLRTVVVRESSSDNASGSTTPGGGGGGGGPRGQKRYWAKDLSTKCYRCGQVGHIADHCQNEAVVKPCPLCGGTDDGHDMRDCPLKAVCFNCGVPGHVSRACRQPRGLPPRRVCTVCLRSGHSKTQCGRVQQPQRYAASTLRHAVCMVCGNRGHYLCKDLKWFFGLNGVTCYNCGRVGHIGAGCDRPRLDVCCLRHNDDLVAQEIERAATYSTAEDIIEQQQRQQQQQQQQRPKQQDPRGRRGGRWGGKAGSNDHNNSNNNSSNDSSRGRQRDPRQDNNRNGNRDRRRVQSVPAPNRRGGGGGGGNYDNSGSNKRGGGDYNRNSNSGSNKRGRWK